MKSGGILYSLALALMIYALFVLWVWTGPAGPILVAGLTHLLLRMGERQRDAQLAAARKLQQADLRRAFDRSSRKP